MPPDVMTGSPPRPETVEVTHEMRGRFGTREAFVHDRAPFVGGTQVSQFFRSVSGVRVAVPLPRAYAYFPGGDLVSGFRDLKLRAYLTPHVSGFEHYRDVHRTRSHIWCQPGGGQHLMHALHAVLEAPLPAAPGTAGRHRRIMFATGEGWVLACDPLALDVEADVQRLAMAAAIARRAESTYAH
ncbi:hypothetical protein JN535_01880 [Cellulosimicrobium cellulans]|uniref:hypothetical protein n=1 Tax=Cellulosimicrobium cellulans TaxID=1710 RepID=UPI0019635637|nr:hypothetical protein [Cellulosimicrobium cellulans]MBN0038921.1 hypothetical protein [Cellulosimicrobium cellulans]